MSDYDINKVSPRPWEFHPTADLILDANGNTVQRNLWNQLHKLHCVNSHDTLTDLCRELVEEFELLLKPHSRGGVCFCDECENIRLILTHARAILDPKEATND